MLGLENKLALLGIESALARFIYLVDLVKQAPQTWFGLGFGATGLLFILPTNFKLATAVVALIILAITILTKNLFWATYSLYLITSQFLEPGKYYSFVLIDIGAIRQEPFFSQGILEGYGLVLSDILAIGLGLILLSLKLRRAITDQTRINTQNALSYLFVACWILVWLLGLYGSSGLAYYPTFSTLNLFQYMKIIVGFIATLVILGGPNRSQVLALLAGMFLFQTVLGSAQSLGQFNALLANQDYVRYYESVEGSQEKLRATGLFLHANQYGLFALIGLLVFMGYSRRVTAPSKLALLQIGWLCLGLLAIVLSQSRTVWLLLALNSVVLIFTHRKLLQIVAKRLHLTLVKMRLLSGLGLLPILFIVLPRLALLRHSFDQGSGSIRLRMISEGWLALHQSPWLGFGVNSNVHTLFRLFPDGYVQDFPYAVHTAYLQLALEIGVPGMLIFFMPWLILLKRLLLKPRDNLIPVLIISNLLVYYLIQPHGGRLELPMLGILLALLLGLTNTIYDPTK